MSDRVTSLRGLMRGQVALVTGVVLPVDADSSQTECGGVGLIPRQNGSEACHLLMHRAMPLRG